MWIWIGVLKVQQTLLLAARVLVALHLLVRVFLRSPSSERDSILGRATAAGRALCF